MKFDIGHVLFIDIVGYSKGLINEQSESLQKLKEIVRETEQFREAAAEGKLLRLPTGDGGALVFRNTPEAPVLCAMEIAQALKNYPELRVRMGVHSGPVNEISDLNEQANIAGAGINIAQRVMDCGDAGHILLSRHVAEDLEHYPRWQAHLHDLGECEVKHGIRISVVNLYNNEIGNPALPEKFRQAKAKGQTAPGLWVAVLPFRGAGDAEMESFANGSRRRNHDRAFAISVFIGHCQRIGRATEGEMGDESGLWRQTRRVTCCREASQGRPRAFE
jgi:hypothetical protein